MIEAMACGTPDIAFRSGLVPEVISGFMVTSVDEAVEAVSCLHTLTRSTVRKAFEDRFTVERMAQDYLAIYQGLPGLRTDAARICRVH